MNCKRPILNRLGWLALIAMATGLLQPAVARAEVTPEYKIKAVYVLNIVRFVKWPANAFAATDSPLVVGVLGENPFDDELEKLLSGRVVEGRTVAVKLLATAAEAKTCQVVFIASAEQANLQRYLETLRNAPVLTIGESEDFLNDGGVIRFLIIESKVRFDINKAQADAEGLQLDSQLLSLANNVRETAEKKEAN